MAQTAAHLADRPQAVAALTRIFLAEIEHFLLTASGVTLKADDRDVFQPSPDDLPVIEIHSL